MKLIIVDDEQLIRMGLEKIILKMDFEIEVAGSFANGMEAWTYLSKPGHEEPDVLITDIKMPMMDGLRLIELVREKNKDISIVVLSGFNEFEYARSALRFGVRDYLLKPVDKTLLFDLLTKLRHEKYAQAAFEDDPGDERLPIESEHHVIDQVKTILERDYDKNFELERLAEMVELNASYLSRLFKNKTNMTITDYLILIRIEKAKQLLSDHPHLKNYEVSSLVGYNDPVYFNKLFKKIVGITPKDYKEKHH
ncbi:response regulator [Paenibacillus solisilvae]|uniref:Response regulator n=1 Tax=Paenibacillus solisilvae TaxID=2486751 RepID=A0ABW0W784_9BACL